MVTKMTTSDPTPNPADDPALTAYALDELDAAEAARIEERLADDDEARRAVEEIRRTAEALTRELAVEPAASLGAAFREVIAKEYVDSARRRSEPATKRRPAPSSVRLLLGPIHRTRATPSRGLRRGTVGGAVAAGAGGPIGSISFSKVNDPKGIRTPVLGEGDRHLSISKASDPKGIRTPVLGEGDRHLSISKPSDPKGIRTPVLNLMSCFPPSARRIPMPRGMGSSRGAR